jgi:PilZ domain
MSNADHPRRLERRWAPRYSFRTDLEIEWGSALLRGSTRDISSNGMFIESPDPLWVGAGFTARLGLDQPVRVDCFVKRVEPGLGMGVTVSVPQEQQQRYRELLSSLSSELPWISTYTRIVRRSSGLRRRFRATANCSDSSCHEICELLT